MSVHFDTNTWLERRQCTVPFMLDLAFEACDTPFRDFFGFPFATSVLHYRTKGDSAHASWLLREGDVKACGRLLTEALGVPSFRRYFRAAHAETLAQLEAILEQEARHEDRCPSSDVVDRLRNFAAAYVSFYKLGAVAEPVQWWVDDLVAGAAPRREKLGPAVASAISVADECGRTLADRRESTVVEALACLERLGCELAAATECDETDLMWFSPTEVIDLDFDFADLTSEAAARREALVHTLAAYPLDDAEMAAMLSLARDRCRDGLPPAAGVAIFVGHEALAVLRRIDRQLGLLAASAEPQTLHGDVVYRAAEPVYEGICRVVAHPHDDAARELGPGEILVTASTTPDFVPVMRSAGAIITDKAGATSHAAIVARELRIPCIVGTRVATAVLRTGQRLRLDLTSGAIAPAGEIGESHPGIAP